MRKLLRKRFLVLFGLLAIIGVAAVLLPPVPPFEQVRRDFRSSDSVLYDRRGEALHSFRVSRQQRRLGWVGLDGLSPRLVEAVVEAEDRRFYRHGGVDPWAMLGALTGYLRDGKLRGASTITMQVAGLLDPDLRSGKGGRSWSQKLRQVLFAETLECAWSKAEILEAYFNLLTYRGELDGIEAASRALFEKDPHGLTQQESLILAALIRAPNAGREEVVERARQLSSRLGWEPLQPPIEEIVETSLNGHRFIQARQEWAPHIAERLLRRPGAEKSVISTLDRTIQIQAVETLRRHLAQIAGQNVRDGAILVVDNASGEVLAYVGNGDPYTSARYVDGVQAFRQAGSTLKPLLFGLALDHRLITPASLLQDSPLDIAVYGGVYRPSNYDNRFRGLVSARTALASSLNVPAVRLLQLVGLEDFIELLRKLDFLEIRDAEFYGPSLALGAADVTLWSLVNAYRTLARGGVWSPLRLEPGGEAGPERRVLGEGAAFVVADILSDREARSATFGLTSPLSTRFWSAVKTGTSKDMRDNWCIGFTSRYTVGVWVGNFSGQPMWNVSGVTGAAPIWSDLVAWLHRNLPSEAFPAPGGVVRQIVSWDGQARFEWFLRGTEVERIEAAPRPARYRIAYPPQGTTIALDPDIPDNLERVFFEANPDPGTLFWKVDGKTLGGHGMWKPVPGRHRLQLLASGGEILDEIWFQVRGAAD